jgi:mitochondrial enoyl-[acyl-carrier protein] reductase / trans-2-enoyl-CoA reductase
VTELSQQGHAGPESNDKENRPARVRVGDWVTFGLPGLGTLRDSIVVPTSCLVPLPARAAALLDRDSDEGKALCHTLAPLFQLGGTALRMLSDFCTLQPGDVILQNAGNSGVGWMTSQLASLIAPDVVVVSVVRRGDRSRRDFETMVHHLTSNAGHCLVAAQEDLQSDKNSLHEFRLKLSSVSDRPPVLALNAVGGESSSLLLQLLGRNGTHVTYGGMSKQPVSIGTGQLVFDNVSMVGYWHSRWMVQHSIAEQQAMIHQLVDWVLDGRIACPPVQCFPLSDFRRGLQADAQQSRNPIRTKLVFDVTR